MRNESFGCFYPATINPGLSENCLTFKELNEHMLDGSR